MLHCDWPMANQYFESFVICVVVAFASHSQLNLISIFLLKVKLYLENIQLCIEYRGDVLILEYAKRKCQFLYSLWKLEMIVVEKRLTSVRINRIKSLLEVNV